MNFEISNDERELLLSLEQGFSEIRIYKAGLYPTVVSFVLGSGKLVTIRADGKGVAPRFEVFTISATEQIIKVEPEEVRTYAVDSSDIAVELLRKSEWSVRSTDEDKAQMLGDTLGATTQYEGRASSIPSAALNSVTLDAGIEIKSSSGWSFLAATSMFPFALYVSDCSFSEAADSSIYDRIALV